MTTVESATVPTDTTKAKATRHPGVKRLPDGRYHVKTTWVDRSCMLDLYDRIAGVQQATIDDEKRKLR